MAVWTSPTMTNYSEPFPYVVSADFNQSGQDSWKAFDRNAASYWGTSGAGGNPNWIKLDCGSTIRVKLTNWTVKGYSSYSPKNVILQGSNDDSSWDNLDSQLLANDGSLQSFDVSMSIRYRYIRLYITDSYVSTNCAIYEITYTGLDAPQYGCYLTERRDRLNMKGVSTQNQLE